MASNAETLEAVEMEKTDIANDYYHLLEYHWNLWLFTNEKQNWEDNLVCVSDFGTVEEFWSLYNHIKTPSMMTHGQDYLLFKKEVIPKWEHPSNKNGGRWLINENNPARLDNVWLTALLLIIGNNLPHGDIINGAVVNIRPKGKVGVWLSDGSNGKKIKDIGRALKKNIANIGKINFHLHTSNVNMFTL